MPRTVTRSLASGGREPPDSGRTPPARAGVNVTPALAGGVLAPGGRLLIATEVEEYFGGMAGIVRAMPALRVVAAETSTGPVEEAGYQTNFERKARLSGTPVWRATFERTAGPVTVA